MAGKQFKQMFTTSFSGSGNQRQSPLTSRTNIVTVHKKGDKSICGNYRWITAGKILARMLLNRLLKFSEEILPESHHNFRSSGSSVYAIYCARQLQGKAREQNRPFPMTMFDLSKAFDSVPREALWRVLERFGCPAIPLYVASVTEWLRKSCIGGNCPLLSQ